MVVVGGDSSHGVLDDTLVNDSNMILQLLTLQYTVFLVLNTFI